MGIIKTVIVGGVIVAAGAVGYYYTRQISLLKSLKYKLISFNLGDITGTTGTATMIFRIFSDSTISAQVQELYIDVFINGKKLGTIEDNVPFIIPAKGYSDVNLAVTFSPQLILADALNLLTDYLGSQDFAINLNGYVKVKTAFISVSVPFTYDTTLKQIMS